MTSNISTAPDIELAEADVMECEVIVTSADNNMEGKELDAKGNKGKRRCLCLICIMLFIAIVLCLYFLWPKKVRLCVKLNFGPEVLSQVAGNEGSYEMEVKNYNYYGLDIHNLSFAAYYGERIEEEKVLSAQIDDWHIGILKTSSRNENYVYSQTFVDVVPSLEVQKCFGQLIDTVSFNVSARMTGCMLGSCVDIENHEIVYTINCRGEGKSGCLDYTKKIF